MSRLLVSHYNGLRTPIRAYSGNPVLYCISFETYTFMMTIRSPQSFADSPQIIADSYAKSVVFI